MTRKDYVAVAEAIRHATESYKECDEGNAVEAINEVRYLLSVVFADDNPRFDADRFAAACGVRS